MNLPLDLIGISLLAGTLASLACGLGALPLALPKVNLQKHTGLANGLAGGLMFSASVYNLILPGIQSNGPVEGLSNIIPVTFGILLGAFFLSYSEKKIDRIEQKAKSLRLFGGKTQMLIVLAMGAHSIPEGVAVGVGYTSGSVYQSDLGNYVALAIGIHNIPEGLAVAIPLRAAGASIHKCFWLAVLTSVPQPLASIPAVIAAWFFTPIMSVLMGFAAGAMIFLVLVELIPDSLAKENPHRMSWSFVLGFCLMIVIQVVL